MTHTMVDTRFSGQVIVDTVAVTEDTTLVTVEVHGTRCDFFPDEARALAVKLIEAVAKAEREDTPEWP